MHSGNLHIISACLVIILVSIVTAIPSMVKSYDVGVAMTFSDDTNDTWFNAVKDFVDIITSSRTSWEKWFLNDYPNVGPYMWTEEEYNGQDNSYADYTELSLVLGHGCVVVFPDGKRVSAIGFADKGCAIPDHIRLGYKSPDDYGFAIWSFIIQCSVLSDDYVGDWLQVMTGVHMILGFANSPIISNADFGVLARRLTGTGGYPQETIQDAFFHTFVAYDGVHNNNIARIIAENADVADHDTIDSFSYQIPVDNVKLIITCYIPG